MKKLLYGIAAFTLLGTTAQAELQPKEAFVHMKKVLKGEWKLSPASKQKGTTGAHENPVVKRMLGKDKVGVAYTPIGAGSSFKEDLLPNTPRWMITMYHCDDVRECTDLLATHYCVKQNQPRFIFNKEESTKNKLIFDCDTDNSEVCDSDDSHVHHIILELSDGYKHLKSSYLVYKNGEMYDKHTIYHFDKME